MGDRRHTQSCTLPSNELFPKLACLHISVKGCKQDEPDQISTILGTYLFVCNGKCFPLSANQLTDLCDSHARHIARSNTILQEKAVSIKGLLDEAIIFDVLICFLDTIGLCLCSELLSSFVGVSDLCRRVGFKPLLVGDFVLGLVLMGDVVDALRRSVISRTKVFQMISPTSRSSGVKALYFAALSLAMSVFHVPLT
jgi:hypothetical protein